MKKMLVMFVIAVLGFSAISTAKDPGIDPRIVAAFEKEFSFAKNVKWLSKDDLAQVSFLLNDQAVTAWYNADAELVTIARNLLFTQLPVPAMNALEKNYPNAAFFGVLEVIRNNEIYYQLTVETKKKTLVVNVTPTGSISVKKRVK